MRFSNNHGRIVVYEDEDMAKSAAPSDCEIEGIWCQFTKSD